MFDTQGLRGESNKKDAKLFAETFISTTSDWYLNSPSFHGQDEKY